MKIIISKRKMRQNTNPWKKIVALFFCIFGIVISVPIHAQRKSPQKVQRRSMYYNQPPEGYSKLGTTDLYYSRKMGRVYVGNVAVGSIDLIGKFGDAFYSSTYGDYGYVVSMEVNQNNAQLVDCLTGSEIDGVAFVADVEQQGDMARVYYSVTNNNDTDAVISLGVYDDVAVGDNISPNISRKLDSYGTPYGMTLMDYSGVQLCVLFGSGLAGVTGCDDFWFGSYYVNATAYSIAGHYSTGSNYMVENAGYDCGIGWCWKNRTIKPGQTQVFSYLIAVGEVNLEPNSSFEVTPDDPEGWNDLNRPHKLALEGTYESPAGLDGMIEYAVEDSEEWHQLTEMIPSGSTFNDSLVAMFDASREKHVIRFRTRDNVGNTTLLPSIEYLDVSFHEYSGIVDKTYTGDSIYQEVECTDVANLQVTTSRYFNNVNAGTASFCIEGVFPYTIGRKSCTFIINPAPLSGSLNLATDSCVYNGQQHYPEWTFTNESYTSLEEGKDYTVTYTDNRYPGTAKVTIKGKGNYTSELTKTFFIDKAPLRDELFSITLPDEDVSYDGSEHKASATTSNGVGQISFTYTLHGESTSLEVGPTEEGYYDIYMQIADGELYYGRPTELVGSFAIYRFDEAEWQSLSLLYAELQQMGVTLPWDIAGGAKNVGKFEELTVREGHVVGFSLANKGMSGLFPVSLMSFTKLENIDLSNNNLSGDVAVAIAAVKMQNPNAFNSLKTLDISNNSYQGNLGIFANCMPNITSLNASNNKFEDLFPALPVSISNLDISNQKMERVVELNMSDLSLEDIGTKVPTILLYDHGNRTYKNSINLLCTKADLATFHKYDTEEWAMQLQISDNQISIPYVSIQNAYHGESGDTLNVLNMTDNDNTDGSSFKITLSFSSGDANFINGVEVTDLQATILYAFGEYGYYPFNFTAADTYKDDYNRINVQDVVCTVNLLLDDDEDSDSDVRGRTRVAMEQSQYAPTDAVIYIRNGKVILSSSVPVAAISISTDKPVDWTINDYGLSQSARGGMMVGYSLTGNIIPAGETVIGLCQGNVTVLKAQLSDYEAREISVSIDNGDATDLERINMDSDEPEAIYDPSGKKVQEMTKGINIIKRGSHYYKVIKK